MTDLIGHITKKTAYSEDAVKSILGEMISFISNELRNGNPVLIPLLGKIYPDDKALVKSNPANGEKLPVEKKRYIGFNPSTSLEKKVQPDWDNLAIQEEEEFGNFYKTEKAKPEVPPSTTNPPNPNRIWTVSVDGGSKNIAEKDLKGIIKPDDYVYSKNVTPNWAIASQVPELAYLLN